MDAGRHEYLSFYNDKQRGSRKLSGTGEAFYAEARFERLSMHAFLQMETVRLEQGGSGLLLQGVVCRNFCDAVWMQAEKVKQLLQRKQVPKIPEQSVRREQK